MTTVSPPAPILRLPEPRPRGEVTGVAVTSALAAFALGQAIQVNNGNLHAAALAWVCVAMVLLICAVRARRLRLLRSLPLAAVMLAIVAIQWSELFVWGVRWVPGAGGGSTTWFICGMAISAAGVIAILGWPDRPIATTALLMAGCLMTGQHVIRATPAPKIDVWQFQQASSEALLRGDNPYGVRLRNPYGTSTDFYGPGIVDEHGWLTVSNPYPPLTLATTTPARLLFGDVRYGHLLAMALAGGVIALAAPRPWGLWAAALLLLTPRSMLVVMAAWTEPLVVLLLATTLACAVHARRWLWLSLGLLLASKQYSIFFVPLAPLLLTGPDRWKQTMRLLLAAGAVAAAVTLPFFLWDPESFLRSVVWMQFRQPFRLDALGFPAMLAHLTGWQMSSAIAFVIAGMTIGLSLRVASRTPAGFAAAASLVLLCFFAFNKQAFCNYYYLVIAGSAFAAAWKPGDVAEASPECADDGPAHARLAA